MRGGGIKSLQDVASRMRGSMPAGDISSQIRCAFHLPEGVLTARREGEVLILCSTDKTVCAALQGMVQPILRSLNANGHSGLRRIRWSAA